MTQLPLSRLDDDPRNPNVCLPETLAKLQANIQRTGLCPPLIVRPHPKTKHRYILIDGHHRKQVLVALGWTEAPCQVWNVDDKEAQLALATLNRLRGTDVPVKRAELLVSLTHTLSVDELAALIPESAGQIQDMVRWLQQDSAALEDALKAEIAAETAALPIPYGFLIDAADQPVVEEALVTFATEHDRGKTFVAICRAALEAHRD